MRDKLLVFGVLAAIPIVPILVLGLLIFATQDGRTAAPAITGLIATDVSYGRHGQIDLVWNPSDAKDFSYYSVYASDTEITDLTELSPIAQVNNRTDVTYQVTRYWAHGVSLELAAFTEDTEYWFAVTAVDADYNESKVGIGVSATIELMPPPTVFITVRSNGTGFNPATVTIPIRTPVVWNAIYRFYRIREPLVGHHTVTSDTGLFHAELTSTNDTFTYTFTEAGVFSYHCEYHPEEIGTVIVE